VDLRFQRVTGGAIDLKASVQAGTLRIEHDPHATEWE
jgi:hypothetical protein